MFECFGLALVDLSSIYILKVCCSKMLNNGILWGNNFSEMLNILDHFEINSNFDQIRKHLKLLYLVLYVGSLFLQTLAVHEFNLVNLWFDPSLALTILSLNNVFQVVFGRIFFCLLMLQFSQCSDIILFLIPFCTNVMWSLNFCLSSYVWLMYLTCFRVIFLPINPQIDLYLTDWIITSFRKYKTTKLFPH